MIYLVLGMGKSGTTLVSKTLHSSGIQMGLDLDTEASYNQVQGKFERLETQAINKAILDCDGVHFLRIKIPSQGGPRLSQSQRRRMLEVVNQCQRQNVDWGFKDPRTCFTYPLWNSVLPQHKLIVVYRSPYEVCLHYKPKASPQAAGLLLEFPTAWRSLRMWHECNKRILEYLREKGRDFVVVSYNRLLESDSEFRKLCRFVGRDLVDVRDKSLYRRRLNETGWVPKAAAKLAKYRARDIEGLFQELQSL